MEGRGLLVCILGVSVWVMLMGSVCVEGGFLWNDEMWRTDVHAHFIPSFYRDALHAKNLLAGGSPTPPWSLPLHLAFMDSFGIQKSIFSLSSPGVTFTQEDDIGEQRELMRKLNEYGAQIVKQYPQRIGYWATLNLPDVEGSILEAEYALTNLGAAGVKVDSNYFGVYLGDPAYDRVMEKLNALNATVFVHPNVLPGGDAATMVHIPALVLDFPFDTTRAAFNLVLNNVLRRYPNINFILSHGGGMLPFVVYRLAAILSYLKRGPTEVLVQEFQKFYIDTALSSGPHSMNSMVHFAHPSHILFGSDWPYSLPLVKEFTQYLDRYPLTDDQKHRINVHNVEALIARAAPNAQTESSTEQELSGKDTDESEIVSNPFVSKDEL